MMELNEARIRLEALEKKADWEGIIALMQDDVSLYADPRYAALMFDEAIYIYSEVYGLWTRHGRRPKILFGAFL